MPIAQHLLVQGVVGLFCAFCCLVLGADPKALTHVVGVQFLGLRL